MSRETINTPPANPETDAMSRSDALMQSVEQTVDDDIGYLEVATGMHPELYLGEKVKMWAVIGADTILGGTAVLKIGEALAGGDKGQALAMGAIALMSFVGHALGTMVERGSISIRREIRSDVENTEGPDA